MKQRKRGIFWIACGIILLLAALLLVLYNWRQDKAGWTETQSYLSALEEYIPQTTEADAVPEEYTLPGTDLLEEYVTESEELPEEIVLEVNGESFLGILTIPSLNLELPVLSEWSYPNLKKSPCRYSGTVAGSDLIIAAHNYRSHFGRISELNTGDQLVFTDCSGKTYIYEVTQTELVAGSNTDAMAEGAEDWDLTLFTCTWSGRNRVTVRAVQVDNDIKGTSKNL
ncbi:MAG: sortase [Ruminococcus sp.]